MNLYIKHVTPGRGHFWQQCHSLNKLGRGLLGDAIHIKYQGSRSCGFREEDFIIFPFITLCRTCDPQGGTIFGPGAKFEQTWKRSTRRWYILNIKVLGLVCSDKKIQV